MQKIKVGDKVKIMVGKDSGREGSVERILPDQGKVVIPNMNMYKKHVKNLPTGQKGGIFDLARPIDISKVALVCPHCKKTTRVGFKFIAEKKKRICKKCAREIDIKAKAKTKKK